MSLSPTAVTFTYQLGDAKLPNPVTVQVKASKGALPVSATVPGGAEWLIVTQTGNATPAALSLRANPSGKVAGTYRVAVTVAATGASNTPQTLNVTLVVKGAPPSLSVSSTSVPFTYVISTPVVPPPDKTLSISSTGAAVAVTLTAPNASWLKLSKSAGFTAAGAPFTVGLSIDPNVLANLTPRLYSATLTITPGDSAIKPIAVPITLEVSPGSPAISSIYPPSVPMGTSNVTLSIIGSNFQANSVVSIGTNQLTPQTVTFVSKTALLAVVPASVLAVNGSYPVTVNNGTLASNVTNLTVAAPTAIVGAVANAASFEHADDSVSPGEIISIFGSGLGPSDLVVNTPLGSPGVYPNRASKTEVQFETTANNFSAPAPIIFAKGDQINAIVPLTALLPYVGTTKKMRVTADVTASPVVWTEYPLNIVAAKPGVFTFDASGQGQAAVLNVNTDGSFTLNTGKTPAAENGNIVIYMTGAGSLSSAVPDGAVVGDSLPLSMTAVAPSVTVNGEACVVSYSGVVPGSVQGLIQINAELPPGVTGMVPLVVTYGSASSQQGVTVSIK
jgi:uncharacterized protein (TIGR03437 family)